MAAGRQREGAYSNRLLVCENSSNLKEAKVGVKSCIDNGILTFNLTFIYLLRSKYGKAYRFDV